MTISVVKGAGSISHNNREFSTSNVDFTKMKDNVFYKQESLEEAYSKLFDAEIERYNSTQKRADRKINDYMQRIKTSGNGEKLFYENIVQVGNKFDCGVGSENEQTAKNILDKYMKGFEKRNPNLYVFNAVLHCDEATPHLHIDYIPVATGYKQGLRVRNSLDKALKEQGIGGAKTKKDNSTIMWQNREKDSLEEIMNEFGIERSAEQVIKKKKMSINQYKAVAEQVKNESSQMPDEVQTQSVIFSKDKVIVKKSELEILETKAKLVNIYENAIAKIENENREISDKLIQKEKDIRALHEQAQDELKIAFEIKEEYQEEYDNQITLNKDYTKLKKQNNELTDEISKQQEQIKYLNQKVNQLLQIILNSIKVFRMLLDKKKEEYAIRDITESQQTLIKSTIKYAINFSDKEDDKNFVEDSKKSEISNDIQDIIDPPRTFSTFLDRIRSNFSNNIDDDFER